LAQTAREDKFGEHIGGVIPNGVNFDIFFTESDRRKEAERVKILMLFQPELLKASTMASKLLGSYVHVTDAFIGNYLSCRIGHAVDECILSANREMLFSVSTLLK
jgi:hypothetical protein